MRTQPILIAALLLIFLLVLLIVLITKPGSEKGESDIGAEPTTVITTVSPTVAQPTTTAPTVAVTETVKKTAAATRVITPTAAQPTSAVSAGGAVDPATGRTLLQYDTTGRYVQATSYPDGQAVPWQLILVNDWNPLPANYEKTVSLVAVGNNQRGDSRILTDLKAMLAAGSAYGIGVQSGYRAASHQSTLYWRQVDRYRAQGYNDTEAQRRAGTVVKRPGYSEHNCGLAMDLGGSGNFKLEEDFKDTPAYAWLIEHCADYGFILRYPKNKESVTGVIYEPWHYRYVGKDAARYIMDNDLCLEEYLQMQGK